MVQILSATQVIIAVVVILLVLLHSGKDAGLSGAFGVGSGAGPFGGGSLVARNLDPWTVAFAVAFVLNVLALLNISQERTDQRGQLLRLVLRDERVGVLHRAQLGVWQDRLELLRVGDREH